MVEEVEGEVRERKLLKYLFRQIRAANPVFPIYPGSHDFACRFRQASSKKLETGHSRNLQVCLIWVFGSQTVRSIRVV